MPNSFISGNARCKKKFSWIRTMTSDLIYDPNVTPDICKNADTALCLWMILNKYIGIAKAKCSINKFRLIVMVLIIDV